MKKQAIRQFGLLKTTAIGGVVFLLPLVVIGVLLAQAGVVVMAIAGFLNRTGLFQSLGMDDTQGYALLVALAVLILLLTCFIAGILARQAIGQRLVGAVEKHLTLLFPRYSIYKDQLAGGLGGDLARERMKPILVTLQGVQRLALEIERTADGQTVTVYLPSAPDPWSGAVGFLPAESVTPVDAPPGEVLATFESLGRGAARFF